MDDHLQTIGLWSWLGWVLFAITALLFYRFWTSDPQTALRNMQQQLDAARDTIAELRALEASWGEEKKKLENEVGRLGADNHDLHTSLDRMKVANKQQAETIALQGETIDRLEKNQRELIKNYDELYKRVVTMQTRLDALEA